MQKKLAGAKLIVADSLRAYQSALSILSKTPAPILIFDSPILLYKQEGMTLLDCPNSNNLLKFEFDDTVIDYTPLLQAIKKPPAQLLKRHRDDLIAEILKSYTASGLLDKFNTFVYANTTPLHRMAVKTALVQFIFGSLNEAQMRQTIEKYIKSTAKSEAGLQPITDYMAGETGSNMRKALAHAQKMENEASKNSKRKIAYKKLANIYNVNQFELNNIILLYRGIK